MYLKIGGFPIFIFYYQTLINLMTESVGNSPCSSRTSNVSAKSPRKTLADFFREDPLNELNDKEIESKTEKGKLCKDDSSVRDLSNEEIDELVGTLRKDSTLRFNLKTNKSRELVDHEINDIQGARMSDDDIGKLRRLANIRIRDDEQQSIFDQDLFDEIYDETTDEKLHEILNSSERSSRLSIPRNEEQISEQNFEISPESNQLDLLQQKRNRAHGKNLSEPSGQNEKRNIFSVDHGQSAPTSPKFVDQDDFSFDIGGSGQSSPVYDQQGFHFGSALTSPISPASPTSSNSSPNARLRKTMKNLSFNRLFRRRSSDSGEQLSEDDYARWRRYKESERGLQIAIEAIRSRMDQWDADVKKKKQIKVNARELGPNFHTVTPTKREWAETRMNRIENMLNETRGTPPTSPSHEAGGEKSNKFLKYWKTKKPRQPKTVIVNPAKKPWRAPKKQCKCKLRFLRTLRQGKYKKELAEGPYINASIYSPEVLEKLEKEGKTVLVTKKYDLVAHAKTVAETKENLILYDQKIAELRKLERKFAALLYEANPEESTEEQRIEIQYEKQHVAQKIVRQLYAIGGVLNLLFINISEMVESGFTEEKKKLSKKLGSLIRRIHRGDEETDGSDKAFLK